MGLHFSSPTSNKATNHSRFNAEEDENPAGPIKPDIEEICKSVKQSLTNVFGVFFGKYRIFFSYRL